MTTTTRPTDAELETLLRELVKHYDPPPSPMQDEDGPTFETFDLRNQHDYEVNHRVVSAALAAADALASAPKAEARPSHGRSGRMMPASDGRRDYRGNIVERPVCHCGNEMLWDGDDADHYCPTARAAGMGE